MVGWLGAMAVAACASSELSMPNAAALVVVLLRADCFPCFDAWIHNCRTWHNKSPRI